MQDFASAAAIGIVQAVCKKLKREESPDLKEIVEHEILPTLHKIYKKLFPDKDISQIITKETVLNMIDENPIVRKNLALALALPSIVRLAIDNYLERLQILLQYA